jgi:hypothetical protein
MSYHAKNSKFKLYSKPLKFTMFSTGVQYSVLYFRAEQEKYYGLRDSLMRFTRMFFGINRYV